MVVVNLGTGALQEAVVVEQVQTADEVLWTAACERHDMRGAQKAVLANQPDDLAVTLRESHGGNLGSARETGKAVGLHCATLYGWGRVQKESDVVLQAEYGIALLDDKQGDPV